MTKEQILLDLATSRAAIAQKYDAVRHELDFASKLSTQVKRKPFAWLGGAAALGWMLSGAKTKIKTKVINRPGDSKSLKSGQRAGKTVAAAEAAEGVAKVGIWATLFGLLRYALPYLRPLITRYATQYAVQYARRYVK